MEFKKSKPLHPEHCLVCLCWKGRLWVNGMDVTENLKKINAAETIVKKWWGEEALAHFREKNKQTKVTK